MVDEKIFERCGVGGEGEGAVVLVSVFDDACDVCEELWSEGSIGVHCKCCEGAAFKLCGVVVFGVFGCFGKVEKAARRVGVTEM